MLPELRSWLGLYTDTIDRNACLIVWLISIMSLWLGSGSVGIEISEWCERDCCEYLPFVRNDIHLIELAKT